MNSDNLDTSAQVLLVSLLYFYHKINLIKMNDEWWLHGGDVTEQGGARVHIMHITIYFLPFFKKNHFIYYFYCFLLNWTVLKLQWHIHIPVCRTNKEVLIQSISRSMGIAWGGQWNKKMFLIFYHIVFVWDRNMVLTWERPKGKCIDPNVQ